MQTVQVEVSLPPPLRVLTQALPWEAITAVLPRHWGQNGTNVAGGRGWPWDVALDGPCVVLRLLQALDSRDMDASVAENVVARGFRGRQHPATAQMRDHATMARASAALGKAGIADVTPWLIREAPG